MIEADQETFDQAQDFHLDAIQLLESLILPCNCFNSQQCHHNAEHSFQIFKHKESLNLNLVHFLNQTSLCNVHKSLLHEIEVVYEDDLDDIDIPLCCSSSCDIHCAADWN